MKKEMWIFLGLLTIFLIAYFLNFTDPKIQTAIMEAFYMLQWYARNHTLACVVPAMFIAGAIATFFSKEAVLRHLGPKANKVEAYWRGVGLRHGAGRLLVQRAADVRGHLSRGRGPGAGLGLPVLRPGDQRHGHLPHRPGAGVRPGHRPGHRLGRVRGHHRPDHGGHLPQGRGEARSGRDATARPAALQTQPVADRAVLRGDDRASWSSATGPIPARRPSRRPTARRCRSPCCWKPPRCSACKSKSRWAS